MRWPWHVRREAYLKTRALADELDAERARHLQDLLDLCLLTGTSVIQFGNVARVWPEQLVQFQEVARRGGHSVLIVTGAGRVHGVYSSDGLY